MPTEKSPQMPAQRVRRRGHTSPFGDRSGGGTRSVTQVVGLGPGIKEEAIVCEQYVPALFAFPVGSGEGRRQEMAWEAGAVSGSSPFGYKQLSIPSTGRLPPQPSVHLSDLHLGS